MYLAWNGKDTTLPDQFQYPIKEKMKKTKPFNIHYFPIIKAFKYRPRNIGHKTQNEDNQNTTQKTKKQLALNTPTQPME